MENNQKKITILSVKKQEDDFNWGFEDEILQQAKKINSIEANKYEIRKGMTKIQNDPFQIRNLNNQPKHNQNPNNPLVHQPNNQKFNANNNLTTNSHNYFENYNNQSSRRQNNQPFTKLTQKSTTEVSSQNMSIHIKNQILTPKKIIPLNSSAISIPMEQLSNVLDLLRRGDIKNLLYLFQRFTPKNSQILKEISDLKHFFQKEEQFYQSVKKSVIGKDDSRILYEDQGFYFFEELPDLFNKITTEIAKKFQISLDYKINTSLKDSIKQKYITVFTELNTIEYNIKKQKQNNIIYLRQFQQTQNKAKELQKSLKKISQNLISSQNSLNSEIQSLKYKIKQLQYKNNLFPIRIKQLEQQKQYLKMQSNNLLMQKISNQPNADQKINKIMDLDNKILSLKQYNKSLLIELQKKQQNYFEISQQNQRQITSLRKKIKFLEKVLQENEQVIQAMQKSLKTVEQNPSKYVLQSSDLIEANQIQLKYRLVNMLSSQFSTKRPTQFKLVYKFNKNVNDNFHTYIDGLSNLLLLVKLQNGVVIGGFCPDAYKKDISTSQGFLYSLTENKVYDVKQEKVGASCMTYQDYFLIFGNSQIRIRVGEDTLFSNFGIPNAYFNTGNNRLSNFMYGSSSSNQNGQRVLPMKGYQVYQVCFTK